VHADADHSRFQTGGAGNNCSSRQLALKGLINTSCTFFKSTQAVNVEFVF
jgi:hypothetical protein